MIEDTHLDEDAKQALAHGRAITRNVRAADGRLHMRKVEPFASGAPEVGGGVMVTYEPWPEQSGFSHDQTLQSLAASIAQIGIWTFDPANSQVFWDERSARITGLENAQGSMTEQAFVERIASSDRAVFTNAMDAAIHEDTALDLELRFNPRNGDTIWLRMRGERAMRGGKRVLVCILADVSESEANKTRSDFMMRELDHRVNNLLAIILSIAEITARSHTDIQTYAKDFRARLESMARTHSLLAQTQWSGPPLRALIEEELYAHTTKDRVQIEGPELNLSPSAAQSLAMLFHELSANAIKHGALSNQEGKVCVAWEELRGAAPALNLRWSESGGPSVVPPERDGFGSKVVNRIISRQLQADVTTKWDEAGIRLTAHIPLAKISMQSIS